MAKTIETRASSVFPCNVKSQSLKFAQFTGFCWAVGWLLFLSFTHGICECVSHMCGYLWCGCFIYFSVYLRLLRVCLCARAACHEVFVVSRITKKKEARSTFDNMFAIVATRALGALMHRTNTTQTGGHNTQSIMYKKNIQHTLANEQTKPKARRGETRIRKTRKKKTVQRSRRTEFWICCRTRRRLETHCFVYEWVCVFILHAKEATQTICLDGTLFFDWSLEIVMQLVIYYVHSKIAGTRAHRANT